MQVEVKRDKNEVGLWIVLKTHSSTKEVKPEKDKYTCITKNVVTRSMYIRKHIMYTFNKCIFQSKNSRNLNKLQVLREAFKYSLQAQTNYELTS